jgi:hypothetical protein
MNRKQYFMSSFNQIFLQRDYVLRHRHVSVSVCILPRHKFWIHLSNFSESSYHSREPRGSCLSPYVLLLTSSTNMSTVWLQGLTLLCGTEILPGDLS